MLRLFYQKIILLVLLQKNLKKFNRLYFSGIYFLTIPNKSPGKKYVFFNARGMKQKKKN
jgi:hypothetical protein